MSDRGIRQATLGSARTKVSHDSGSGSTTGWSVSSRSLRLLVGVAIALLATWTFLHRTVVEGSHSHDMGEISGPQREHVAHVQQLLRDTKGLLAQIEMSNLTQALSPHTASDLKHVEHDTSVNAAILQEMEALKHQYRESQTALHAAEAAKTAAEAALARTKASTKEFYPDTTNVAMGASATAIVELEHCKKDLEHARASSTDAVAATTASALSTATAAATDGKHNHDNWLVIGIPTVARAENQDYLLQTLASMAHQLPTDPADLLYKRVKIIVLNIDGRGHKRFYEAVKMFGGGHETPDPIDGTRGRLGADHFPSHFTPERTLTNHHESHRRRLSHGTHSYFEFITLSEEYKKGALDFQDVRQGATAANDRGNPNRPGYRVRKQTRSIAQVLARAAGRGSHYMFLEDDMVLCPHGFASMHYMLSKASRYAPDWIAIRASYGMNGIFIHDKDIEHFYHYLVDGQARRPPDHLVVEWFAGEKPPSKAHKAGRAHLSYRFNLFDHIGISSTLRQEKQTTFPRCYEGLGVPTLFRVEAFNPRECPKDDIWPCTHDNTKVAEGDQSIVLWANVQQQKKQKL